ncbi:DNA pilot protein [Chifec microvirus UA13_18]|nr:DNA pilot protein [Chifec microvirus UA13_18]
MSFWSGLSSVLSPLASIGGSLWSSSQNQASAQDSINFQREVLQNRNQWAVADLKKAGLNPILAAGATSSGSAAGATSQTENPASGLSNSAIAAHQLRLQERQQKNNDLVAQSQAELNSAKALREAKEVEDIGQKLESGWYQSNVELFGANAAQSRANANVLQERVGVLRQEVLESQQRVNHIKSEIAYLEQQRRESNSRIQLNAVNARLSDAQTALSAANRQYTQSQTQLSTTNAELARLSIPEKRNEAEYFERARKGLIKYLNPRSVAGSTIHGTFKHSR